MKKLFYVGVLILSIILFISSCQLDMNNVAKNDLSDTGGLMKAEISNKKIIKDVGTIRYINLEGGFYGIIGKKGKYDPINLPEIFMQDGLKVEFTAEFATDMGSIHMWGKLVKLITMVTLDCKKQLVMDEGVVDHVYIQGGPWIIRGKTDTYQPINLPKSYHVKNLKVRFVGVIRKDIIIIPALWPILEIVEIEKVEENPVIVKLFEKFKLPEKKSALEPRGQVLLTFNSVLSDSRCPKGVDCMWKGEAIIEVNVKIRNRDYGNFKMSTRYSPSIIYVGNYYIRFFDLYPYPVYGETFARPSYVGIFLIGSLLDKPSTIQ